MMISEKSVYFIVQRVNIYILNYSNWIRGSSTKVKKIEASLQSGISLNEIFIIIKYLKKRIFFIDIFLPFLIATLLKNLCIYTFNLNLAYYTDFILSGTIFLVITYIIGFMLKKLNLSKNIRNKNFIPYIFYRYFNMTLFYLIHPILSVIIWSLYNDVELFPQVLPSNTEITESLYPTEPIDGLNIGRLAETADALSICESTLNTCQSYIGLLTNIINNMVDISNSETINDIKNHRNELYGMLKEGQIHLSDNSILSNILGKKTRIRGLTSELLGPRGKEHVINDIRLLHEQLRSIKEFRDIFTAEFEGVTKEVASDFKSKLDLDESIPNSKIMDAVKQNTIKYRDTSSKNIAENIAKELGYVKITNIKF